MDIDDDITAMEYYLFEVYTKNKRKIKRKFKDDIELLEEHLKRNEDEYELARARFCSVVLKN
jgi:hypothetical protein